MQFLVGLKDYLSDRPEAAFLALTIVVIVYLYRDNKQIRAEHIETLKIMLPLQANLHRLVEKLKGKNDE